MRAAESSPVGTRDGSMRAPGTVSFAARHGVDAFPEAARRSAQEVVCREPTVGSSLVRTLCAPDFEP